MNWKQLAKAVVDEVKKWADERFADVAKVKLLVSAETREANEATVARIAALQGPVDELGRKVRELAARAAPTATVDGAAITAAVSAWFERNPPPTPKDGTSVKVEDLEPYLQAGLAKWQLEFERNASGVLQRFLDKLRQPKDGEPGKDATPEGIAAAVTAWFKATPLAIPAEHLEATVGAAVAAYVRENPVPAGKDGDPGAPPSPAAVGAAVAEYMGAHPPAVAKDGEPGRAPTAAEIGDAVARHLEAHPIRQPVDGKDASSEQVGAAVAAFMAEHPVPELDAEVLLNSALATVEEAVAQWLRKNPPPGPSGQAIADAVAAHLEKHPAPARGPTPEELAPLVAAWLKAHPPAPGDKGDKGDAGGPPSVETVAAAVAAYLREHPPAAGKDGDKGQGVTLDEVRPLFDAAFATWALEFERRAAETFERAVDRIEKPKDGRDGLDVSNLGVELDPDGRTLRFVLSDGERRHVAECRLPIPLDRGVFKDGATYERGDLVTFGGSMWIAQKDAPAGRPGSSVDWRLAVKHGRDAKK